jgi:hypothetical protein
MLIARAHAHLQLREPQRLIVQAAILPIAEPCIALLAQVLARLSHFAVVPPSQHRC